MIKTILVPTDGSSHADKAIALATDIAAKYKARLVFLHVMEEGPVPEALRHMAEVEHVAEESPEGPIAAVPEGKFPASINVAGKSEEEDYRVRRFVADKILSEAKKAAKSKDVTNVECVVEAGKPAEKILDQAKREEANLIVMGSRGLSDLKGLLVGSVSHKVSQLSPCSCVSVK